MTDGSDAAAIAGLVSRFFEAVEIGDLQAVRACLDPNAVVWRSHDTHEQTLEEYLSLLAAFFLATSVRRYDHDVRDVFEGGFLEEYVLHMATRDGVALELPACVVGRVEGGRIARLDEYFDEEKLYAAIDAVRRALVRAS